MTILSLGECTARAEQEREYAADATLQNVRERHLRSAKSWEDLGKQVKQIAKLRAARAARAGLAT